MAKRFSDFSDSAVAGIRAPTDMPKGATVLNRRTGVMVMEFTTDPRDEIMDAVGKYLDEIVLVRPADVLVGCFERSREQKTAGGLIIPDKSLGEDKFQGCSGLILKMGPLAFTDDAAAKIKWGGTVPKVGDWVAYDVRDTRSREIAGADGTRKNCRLMNESAIDMILPRPDIVW